MIKAKFMSEQKPVRIVKCDNKIYIFICLNGEIGIFKYNDEGVVTTENYIEYDYNEFVVNENEIDINDVMTNPNKYLNYPLPEVTELEKLRADIDYLLMLEG